jgi:hypothetical protein
MSKPKLTLTVHELPVVDCWKDMVRIPRDYRVDVNGKRMRRAKLCKVMITVVQFEAISKRARTLAEEHLNRWMFQHKKATYTKIARDLMDTNRWPAHGQMISSKDVKQLEFEVEYLQPESEQWRSYWGLYCLQRLALKDREKLF